ncbi:hypothetical protein Efla_001322 [Eimeria flavescens]
MYCGLLGAFPCASARSVAWWGDRLLLGTDAGNLVTVEAPQLPLKKPQAQSEGGSLGDGGGVSLHSKTFNAHVGQLQCICTEDGGGLVATADAEGSWSIWRQANGEWTCCASSLGGCSCVVGLQWVSPSSHPTHVSLCSLHEDGHLHTGTSEGHRLWSRDMRKRCRRFCATANGAKFVVATEEGELLVYDSRGVYSRRLLKAEGSRYEAVTDLCWQPGSWAIRPLLVAFSTGQAYLLHTDKSISALPIDSGLKSCVAARWNPSGSHAALLGVLTLGFKAAAAACAANTKESVVMPLSTGIEGPAVGIRIVHVSGQPTVSVHLPCTDPRALAWAPCGDLIAALTAERLFVLLPRQPATFARSERGLCVAGRLNPEKTTTDLCFWRVKSSARCTRIVRGPRLLTCCEDRCALVPHATTALPPDFSWDFEACSSDQSQQHQAQQQAPYVLPEEEGSPGTNPPTHKQQHARASQGFPVELCDGTGSLIESLTSPLNPHHAVLLPHCLVVADGSQHLWCCWIGTGAGEDVNRAVSVVDLVTVSRLSAGSVQVTALGGRETCIAVATAKRQLLILKLPLDTPEVHLETFMQASHELEYLQLNVGSTALAGRDPEGRLHIVEAAALSGKTGELSSSLFFSNKASS